MEDFNRWLAGIGLEKYASILAENEIDFRSLRHLSEDDLLELGLSLGARRCLQAEIGKLNQNLSGHQAHRTVQRSEEAERRQLTVMFCDLAHSTELSQRLDLEDLSRVIGAYQSTCVDLIKKYNGFVARYMGDGLMVYFGFPEASENDVDRAILAGLEIVAASKTLDATTGSQYAVEFKIRVGIATGTVVVGKLIGEGLSQEHAVVGETPNLAARLQSFAAPNTVVISPTTKRIAGSRFQYIDRGAQTLKGISKPVTVWQVLEQNGVPAAMQSNQTTPLVGRNHEFGLLLARWRQVLSGKGQVVAISGEAGIGKSRLVAAVTKEIGNIGGEPLCFQCSPDHFNSAFFPIVSLVKSHTAIEQGDSATGKLKKIENFIASTDLDPEEAVPVIAQLLLIPTTNTKYRTLNLTPDNMKLRITNVLLQWTVGRSVSRPALIIVEDLHWVDPSSLEFIQSLVARALTEKVLVVLTHRHEFSKLWTDSGHITRMSLNRLDREAVAELIDNLASSRNIPMTIREELINKTDGVPLFAEEMTMNLLELQHSEVVFGPLEHALPEIDIPATLKDSLMARLDRLGSAREYAQMASVIGREFSLELLAATSDCTIDRLEEPLSRLVKSGLLSKKPGDRESVFYFKHALIRDTAYDTLLKAKRKLLHGRLASAMSSHYPDLAVQQPELLAHHYAEAGLVEQAIPHFLSAGAMAIERSANHEARAQLSSGLSLLLELPVSIERDHTELRFQVSMGSALIPIMGFAHKDVENTYMRARDLGEKLNSEKSLFVSIWGLWVGCLSRAENEAARKLCQQMLDLAAVQSDKSSSLQAHHSAWTSFFAKGDLQGTLQHTKTGARHYCPEDHAQQTYYFGGHDPGVCAKNIESWTLWLLGYPDRAIESARAGTELARTLSHPFSLGQSIAFSAQLHCYRGELSEAVVSATEAIGIAHAHGYSGGIWTTIARATDSLNVFRHTNQERGIELLVDLLSQKGPRMFRPFHLATLAQMYFKVDQCSDALLVVDEALALVHEIDEHWWEPEIYRLKGEFLLADKGALVDCPDICFEKGIAVAQELAAKSLELRLVTSHGRLHLNRGDSALAYETVNPVLQWFTEGHGTFDLVQASQVCRECEMLGNR